ncbi:MULTISPECIES: DUF4118 domain-containing protein [unclassified Sedimentibacter]|uniref:DUF4118 domain-containing protein n=1 Tax=unclassified Sedimentibacter TaxID=2649220 RepID=UPI0027DFAC49|nr:DUF4118 domain-containing protein [Sedimentibacter sp. MB35-C1]WMJ78935.1 DUF4118 domain-containing protein [Sedimentibacter sp. MB35-C1]
MKNKSKKIKNIKLQYSLRVIAICVISMLLSIIINEFGIGKENTLMVFIVGVLAVTIVTRGYVYSAIASIVSVLMFNYMFTNPVHSLKISNTHDIILMMFFLIAALISSNMTSKLQYQTESSKRNEKTAKFLYEITKGFLNVTGNENIILKGIKYIKEYAGYDCCVKLNSEEKVYGTLGSTEYSKVDEINTMIVPIKGVAKQRGEVRIIIDDALSQEKDMLIKAIVHQMAIILDREFIYEERQKIKVDIERERLKSTLLRSISHDIRTPLTSIKGASELICDNYDNLDEDNIKKLASDIFDESTWLMKTVQNILDMTRINEGKLTVKKSYEAVDDIVNQTLSLVPRLHETGRLCVKIPDDIVLVPVDGRLFVQVLVNLLDNEYKHAGESADICLSVYVEDKFVIFEVSDNGIGIEPSMLNKIFDGFVTRQKNNIADGSLGVGLGLSICKEIVNAHGGKIIAHNLKAGGASFKIELPMEVE